MAVTFFPGGPCPFPSPPLDKKEGGGLGGITRTVWNVFPSMPVARVPSPTLPLHLPIFSSLPPQRVSPSAEMVMIDRMFIQEEKTTLALDKQLAKEKPGERGERRSPPLLSA